MQEDEYARALFDQQNKTIENDPNALYADTMREEKITNIIAQISPDNLLNEIEHRIRGEKKNHYTQEWERISPKSKPISEELVANFISFLGAVLNQNTSLSNFSAGEINNIMEIIIDWVKNDLTDNDITYGIQGRYMEMERIANIICLTCFTVLKRAQNGLEAGRMWKSLRVSETMGQPKKKGLMDAMKFW